MKLPASRWLLCAVCAAIELFGIALSSASAVAPSWQSALTKDPPGSFPELRPLRGIYRFGWAGFTAATGQVHFTKTSDGHFQLDGTGKTSGLVRALWRLDASYRALADAETLRPIEMTQIETYRRKKLTTRLHFTTNGVSRVRTESPDVGAAKTREFRFPNLFDLHSASLYLRSQPLKDSSAYRIVVFPATSAYEATLTVVGREKIIVHAGSFKAIKIDLQLKRIGKNFDLEPHRKFRRATIWISDDADRLVLRVEAQIFVGTVFAELQSMELDTPRS